MLGLSQFLAAFVLCDVTCCGPSVMSHADRHKRG